MDLSYFEAVNDDGEVSYIRPETKSTTDLERVIALGKPEPVVSKFAEMVAIGEQWEWFDSYRKYLADIDAVNQYNSNLPSLVGSDGEMTEPEKKPPPAEPVRPDILTTEQVLLPYYKARREAAYPDLSEFADAFVKSKSGDNEMLDSYVLKCKNIKESIPKS
jgi:hypothetical protein